MIRWPGLACLMMLVAAPLFAQKSCDTEVQVHAVHTRQSDLAQQWTEKQATDDPVDVPARMRTQISGLKDALASAVEAEMHCTPSNETAAAIEMRLVKLLGADQPALTKDVPTYGTGLKVTVVAPANAQQLRAVKVSFGIECGDDSMLLMYEPGANGWRRSMRWQSSEYAQVSGAFGDFFEYTVVSGSPVRVAVAHGHPWCTSRWSGFSIDLLEATPDGNTPKVAWHRQESYVRESAPSMTTKPGGFELRADVGTIETEQMTRKGVFRYQVSGDTVQRIQPIAVDGRGFVDAWLEAPWSTAKGWSAAEGLAGFERAHEAFEKAHNAGSVTYSYGPVRACTAKGRYEVEIDADPGGPQFYAIEQGTDGYTMVNFGTTQDERCSGPDIMKKR